MTDYKFKAGKTYNLRGGGTAEILKVDEDFLAGRSIVGIVTNRDKDRFPLMWYASGHQYCEKTLDAFNNRVLANYDLLPPEPERVSLWMNIYPNNSVSTINFDTREHADRSASIFRTHVLELIYEDGVFVDVIKHKVGE